MPEPREFICEAYRFEPATGTLALHYAFDTGVRFEERIVFPVAERRLSEQENAALDRVFRLLLLACGVSYYKAFAPDRITCRAFPLDPATVAFFTEFYVKGLAEFAYRNGIDLVSRLRIAADAIDAPSAIGLTLPRRTCVPVGGGKDSDCHGGVPEAGRRAAAAVLAWHRRSDRGNHPAVRYAGNSRDAAARSDAVRA